MLQTDNPPQSTRASIDKHALGRMPLSRASAPVASTATPSAAPPAAAAAPSSSSSSSAAALIDDQPRNALKAHHADRLLRQGWHRRTAWQPRASRLSKSRVTGFASKAPFQASHHKACHVGKLSAHAIVRHLQPLCSRDNAASIATMGQNRGSSLQIVVKIEGTTLRGS